MCPLTSSVKTYLAMSENIFGFQDSGLECYQCLEGKDAANRTALHRIAFHTKKTTHPDQNTNSTDIEKYQFNV